MFRTFFSVSASGEDRGLKIWDENLESFEFKGKTFLCLDFNDVHSQSKSDPILDQFIDEINK